MPVTCAVVATSRAASGTAGQCLRRMGEGAWEPASLAVIAVGSGGEVAADPALDGVLGPSARDVVAAYEHSGRPGHIAQTVTRAGQSPVRVAFLGVGERSPADLRRAGGELGRLLRPGELVLADAAAGLPADQVAAFTEGILLGSYRYSAPAADSGGQPAEVRLLVDDPARPGPAGFAALAGAVERASVIAGAVALARDLANAPAPGKSPHWLAGQAAQVAERAGLGIRVLDEAGLAAAGFGGILAVGSGSHRRPRLIELRYDPPGAPRHAVLVGKGITFDSGGLNLKPNDGMKAMKTDMAGAGAVIAAMSALGALGVGQRVTGLAAAAENMPSGSAYRPGDVITQYGGTTVEVLNTDAEGRLVLADALAYADAELAPDVLVDLATLTGSARVALGSGRAALYSTDEDLAAALLAAGEACGDRLWRMPLAAEYADALGSPVADLANVPRAEGLPGSIVAALFLRRFAGRRAWAHLDIAGAARAARDDGELSAGATGFGTRLLLRWLADGGPASAVSAPERAA